MPTATKRTSEFQDLQARVTNLEKQLAELRDQLVRRTAQGQTPWWEQIVGTRANDPAFEEVVREGRKYRKKYRTDYETKGAQSQKAATRSSQGSRKSRKAS